MSSCSPISLASLDQALALLGESRRGIKAAQSFDTAEVTRQFKAAAESAGIVREAVWSEMPAASWRNREELDARIDEIQEIIASRAVKVQRARLLALATALERGRIVHRRAQRCDELNRLRDQAIDELRCQAGSEEAPQTLPGPAAEQWMAWAWGLQEPDDAEAVHALRNGFARLDDFVANLEPNMWMSGPPVPEVLPVQEKSAEIQTEPFRTEEKGYDTPASSSATRLGTELGLDVKDRVVPHLASTVNPPLNGWEAGAARTPHSRYDGAGLGASLACLDASLAVLDEILEKLKAAQAVDMAEVTEQLTMAAESGGVVRGSVWAELPEASWQNREELDALVEQIQAIVAARILEQRRSRLLDLAAELERGRIVHRRAHRANELNQLRELAIEELRSQAGLEGGQQSVPGPEAERWIEWACGLQEPQDAESLQALHSGFVHLDDFVANLERNMWIAGESPVAVNPPLGLESNTLTPNDGTPPRTEEDGKRMAVQEQSLMASLMGLIRGPGGEYDAAAERPFTAALFRETDVAPANLSLQPRVQRDSSVESPPPPEVSPDPSATPPHSAVSPVVEFPMESAATTEVLQAVNAPPVRVVRGRAALLQNPVLRPIAARVFRAKSAAPADISDDKAHDSGSPVLRPFLTKDRGEVSAVSTPLPEVTAEIAETWALRWPMRMVAALLVLTAVGALLWKSRAKNARTTPVAAIEAKAPALQPGNPVGNEAGPSSGTSAALETQAASAKTSAKEDKNQPEQSLAPKPASKASPAKPGSKREAGLSQTATVVPGNIVVPNSTEATPNDKTETPTAIAGGLPTGTSNIVFNSGNNTRPGAANTPDKTVRISSGVTQTLLLHTVPPRYPQQAMIERVQGTVVLQALITKDGTVQNLKVVSGHPLLNEAAIDAVKQWRYKPYQLNGEPVEAVTQINVNFKFGGR